MRLRELLGSVLAGLLLLAVSHSALAAGKGPTVFAAASLKTALDTIAADWGKKGGGSPVISYAASSALAKQIEQGAAADIFISADLDWMDYLAERDLIKPETRFNLLGNQLVLIAPQVSDLAVTIAPSFPLGALLGAGRLAVANVDAVPAGKYAKAALVSLGVWDEVKDKLAQAENVRAALLLVSRGEAPLGIVYATDATSDPEVKVVGIFPEETHPPIVYPVAELLDAKSPDTGDFFAYLSSSEARQRFEEQGFTVLSRP